MYDIHIENAKHKHKEHHKKYNIEEVTSRKVLLYYSQDSSVSSKSNKRKFFVFLFAKYSAKSTRPDAPTVT